MTLAAPRRRRRRRWTSAASLGKMLTTSVRRLISLFSRSTGFVEWIFRDQCESCLADVRHFRRWATCPAPCKISGIGLSRSASSRCERSQSARALVMPTNARRGAANPHANPTAPNTNPLRLASMPNRVERTALPAPMGAKKAIRRGPPRARSAPSTPQTTRRARRDATPRVARQDPVERVRLDRPIERHGEEGFDPQQGDHHQKGCRGLGCISVSPRVANELVMGESLGSG